VNTPEDVCVEDVDQLHMDAWKLGVKAIAIYRDNCKVAQPLATQKRETKSETVTVAEGDGERYSTIYDVARLLAARRGDSVRIEEVSDPDDPEQALYASGGLLPGPDAVLAGPTFEQWVAQSSNQVVPT
jgi:ribonucleotide reductase alpha subunit